MRKLSPKQGLTSAKDITIEFPERHETYATTLLLLYTRLKGL